MPETKHLAQNPQSLQEKSQQHFSALSHIKNTKSIFTFAEKIFKSYFFSPVTQLQPRILKFKQKISQIHFC